MEKMHLIFLNHRYDSQAIEPCNYPILVQKIYLVFEYFIDSQCSTMDIITTKISDWTITHNQSIFFVPSINDGDGHNRDHKNQNRDRVMSLVLLPDRSMPPCTNSRTLTDSKLSSCIGGLLN